MVGGWVSVFLRQGGEFFYGACLLDLYPGFYSIVRPIDWLERLYCWE